MENKNLFEKFVGQHDVKRKLGFYLNAYHTTKIFPSTLFASPKGFGKSAIARETAANLYEYDENGAVVTKPDGVTPKSKGFIELNASTIKNARYFVTEVLVKHCVDKKTTVFIDELHSLKDCVAQILLTVLNPSAANFNTFCFDNYQVDIDFRNFTFLCATTETDKIFPPLLDRLHRIQLQEYSTEDLAKIVQRAAPEIDFQDGVLADISTVVRGNPRASVKMASDIKTYACETKKFGAKAWADLKSILSIRPLGLTSTEILLLRLMAANPNGSSLTNLAARTGLSKTVIQADYESYLQRNNLMRIEAGRGRVISAAGQDYLKNLDACPA